MNTRTYPYKAWTATQYGKLVELELVRCYWHEWDQAATRKCYDTRKLHATKTLAVIAALEKLDAKEERLKRQMLQLEKRRAALERARVEK